MLCNICPRQCGVDRKSHKGVCAMTEELTVARVSKHFWEEPPISGTRGSGTIFFSGCNLNCVYCQNYEISHGGKGKIISEQRLIEIFGELERDGVHNINLVSPTHYALKIARVLERARPQLPVVYNSSGYEKKETLRELSGKIQIYLPDLKYISEERSSKYSCAPDYFHYASEAVKEMKRQCPENIYNDEGIMEKGIIIRHLILPKNTNQSLRILDWIKENLGCDTCLSLMAQYTPHGNIRDFPELGRKITRREYDKVVDYARDLGFCNVFTQDFSSAREAYIPEFDLRGV